MNYKNVCAILITVLIALTACTAQRPALRSVQDSTHRASHNERLKYKHDSIYVYVDKWREVRGDTVYVSKDSIVYRYLESTDTIRLCDSIYVDNSTVQTIEVNRLTRTQRTLINLGWLTIGALVLLVIIAIRKVVRVGL